MGANEQKIYEAMITERNRISAQLISEGTAKYNEIVSKAKLEATTLESKAKQQAAEDMATGDKESQNIINATIKNMNNDQSLYAFIKKLETYETGLKPGMKIYLNPNNSIFDTLVNIGN
jgi:membrane protease subunit HflC